MSKIFLILRKTPRDTVNVYNSLHVKHQLFLSLANQIRIFSTYFRKIHKYKISSISVHWKASCSRGRTDMTKLIIISFRNVENAPKNGEQADNTCRHRTKFSRRSDQAPSVISYIYIYICSCVCVYICV